MTEQAFVQLAATIAEIVFGAATVAVIGATLIQRLRRAGRDRGKVPYE